MLRVCQSRKDKHCIILLGEVPRAVKFIGTESREWWLPGAGGQGEWDVII